MKRPLVLMVTGTYAPETSGASLQCRQLIASLRADVDFTVLTTSANPDLPRRDIVDGVDVRRIYVDPSRHWTKLGALASMAAALAGLARRVDVLHIHGFSQKNVLLLTLARLFQMRTVMKLTSVGHDDALTMRRKGGAAYACYRRVDCAIAVSPRLEQAWQEAGLDPRRVVFIPNAVDTHRFRPASDVERESLRRRLDWPADLPVVLFVGFFSHEKRPDLLYRAWARLWEKGVQSTLVLVGPTRSAYFEIDPSIAAAVRADAGRRGLTPYLRFVESTTEIEHYFRAADVFALPTTREGLPNVLLEAMASGVPPVISRLPGVTDWIVDDGATGRLVATTDEGALVTALEELVASPDLRGRMGQAGRAHVERHFTLASTAARTLDVYQRVLSRHALVPA